MKQKIMNFAGFYWSIKRVTDTDILMKITEPPKHRYFERGESSENSGNSGNSDGSGNGGNTRANSGEDVPNAPFSFANIAYGTIRSHNPLHANVIYDSGAANHLTFEKSRFVGEIIPTSKDQDQWVCTPNENMKIAEYDTMLVKGTANGAPRDLLFNNTAYVPDSEVTLVSANLLQDKGY